MDILKIAVKEDGVAIVELHRPEARNALNLALREALANAFDTLDADKNVKVIVLTGGEKIFAAGADVNDFLTATTSQMYLRHTEKYWKSISNCSKPIIAAVNGYALGGGCELAMHADIIIASETATFGQPEVKLGLMPGAGGTQRLLRAIGKYKTMLLVLTGKLIPAQEALQMGLVSEVTAGDATPKAIEIANTIAGFSTIAVQQIKEVTNLGQDMSLDGALALERKALQILFDTKDQKEGAKAFLEKRPAVYQGE
ncbi:MULTISPECIES: enoyl-CoA hydratase-related protein [unclassified Acinetobacter]|uniref:enoyl-CoA hydratase-related protein n=1 Tax=unclassified Acinetobacter TaxID=196816 RepID=UPI0015D45301|nr:MULTISPECIES: enoyl-CoA hydratase-related protein [unclassified Acinetobacter]